MTNYLQPPTQQADAKPEGFRSIYTLYAPKVFNYLWYRVGNNYAVAEDLMQETFLRAFERLPFYTQRGYSYLTYLITIAHNQLMNYFRRPITLSLEEAYYLTVDTSSEVERRLMASHVWNHIRRLPPSEYRLFDLRYRQDLSIKAISKKVHKSANAIKLTLSRSREKIRRELAQEDQLQKASYHRTAQPTTA